ncbi:hypothetical protein A2276_02365 [candidate division WOR-1 bacterium RIFOXYA12_FULL_43_27]|uniref:Glycosyltransferase RgtA/B/C/D-like domain-containing protein n=1 Tax=candidate division WOR-1 bacterium RIFOXYC2_FULL_46_14 TaxID=1802587 RepID=A0A1F4U9R3_UNCSA|nr:MAG: hypothetical protein A2276_02365 [candidate division WOR-1 bacterium RIFOXYA12_FULL_43_27]OGC19444.1 MAG: hypothetical protein A2292_01965 [candidate division WOR-1 bacterium RIFOXYB2_FULL_46_45]OGC30433.1 MAG: hypothetical protein A2232_01965 [candidate division WOR-1 bacterium RIFOXYA2_FULL_46_56]OGC41033.1 MAG: hypothetical protein A2438_01965 [candidate division WOR-1 bacterium RIFOXYC2_FULL_46_14]
MLKKYWQYILLAFLVVLFWYPVTQNNDFFMDDWGYINPIQEGRVDFGYFFTPLNEHFVPMTKAVFCLMFGIFGLNIVPYIWLLIFVHAINTGLFFYLCRLNFPSAKWLPLALAVFFLSNSAYYEVIHMISNFSMASSLMFLQISLIFLHLYVQNGNKKLLWISLVSSFFIPMNFSLGLVGIVFIAMYYFLVLRQARIRILAFYVVPWLSFLTLWLIFVYPTAIAAKTGMAANYANVLPNILSGFGGFLFKSLGIGILMQPFNIWVAGFLLFNLIVFGFLLLLYFILNPKNGRGRIVHDRGIAWFSFLGALISYGAIAVARTDLPSSVFLDWGRYQFFSVFFLTIFMGNLILPLILAFSSLFNKDRLKYYFLFLFVLYLLGQFMTIRVKAESPVRTEGLIPNQIEIPV